MDFSVFYHSSKYIFLRCGNNSYLNIAYYYQRFPNINQAYYMDVSLQIATLFPPGGKQ